MSDFYSVFVFPLEYGGRLCACGIFFTSFVDSSTLRVYKNIHVLRCVSLCPCGIRELHSASGAFFPSFVSLAPMLRTQRGKFLLALTFRNFIPALKRGRLFRQLSPALCFYLATLGLISTERLGKTSANHLRALCQKSFPSPIFFSSFFCCSGTSPCVSWRRLETYCGSEASPTSFSSFYVSRKFFS